MEAARFIAPPYSIKQGQMERYDNDILSKIFTTSEIKESRQKGSK